MTFLHRTKSSSVSTIPAGSTIRFTADNIEYVLYDVTDDLHATAHGGIFDGERVKIGTAQIKGENVGDGSLFQQGASARLLGFVIREDPPTDDDHRARAKTSLVTGPVQTLSITDPQTENEEVIF